MAVKVSAKNAIEDGQKIERVWDDHDDFKMKDVTRADYKSLLAEVMDEDTQITELMRQASALINSRDGKAAIFSKQTTRARSGMRGYFGPDSTEYEQAGGTRTSEIKRKPRPTKPKP